MPAGIGRALVLASVFVCAACGLVYELELVALASYVGGDSVTQASVVLSVMVFAMGVGSLLAKRLRCRAATGFAAVEALLALVGGGSAMALYASFAWLGGASAAVVVFSFAIGVLIGAEMPLLMSLIQRIRQQDAGGAVADLFAADYVGALIGGLAFPFLLLPFFGQLTGALLTGVVNALAGGAVVLWLFRHDMSRHVRWGLLAANGGVVLLLAAGGVFVAPFERAAREAVYGPDVRVAVGEGEEAAVLTGPAGGRARGGSGSGAGSPTGSPAGGDSRAGAGGASGAGGDGAAGRAGGGVLRFYVGGALRVSSDEGNVLPAALVRPAMESGPHARVLVLGGEDGLALREVLRHAGVRHVTVLEQRARAAELARTDPGLRRLNGGAYDDPRVRLVRGRDAFAELRARARRPEPYDVVVSDLPDPSVQDVAKLYSQEFYGLVARSLTPGGRLAVRAAPAAAAPRTYWTVEATLRAAGLRTEPYVVREPRDTGFVLASRGGAARGVVLGDGNGGGDGDADGDVVTGGDGGVVTGVTGGGGRAGAGARGVPGPDAPAGAVVGQRRLLVGAERLGPGRVAPVPRTPTTRQLHAAGERAERSRIRGLPPSTLMRPRY